MSAVNDSGLASRDPNATAMSKGDKDASAVEDAKSAAPREPSVMKTEKGEEV
jgi:hypothetical protein